MSVIFGLIAGMLGMVVTKAVLEPIAKRLGVMFIPAAVAETLNLLDPYMPELLAELTSAELEALVRSQLEQLTGEPWKAERQTEQFFELFDPRKTAEHLLSDKPDPGILRQLIYNGVQKAKG